MYVAWKKSQFLWPYVYVTCSATLTTVLVQVCTTHTLALISMSAVITIGLVVTFSACESRVVVLVSALVVVGTTIGPTLPALEVFIPLAIAGTLVIVGSTVLTTTHTSVGRFFVGAAAPIGVIDALYALIWQGHPSLLVAFAASDMTPTDLGVGLVTVVLAAISGLVVLRRVCCLDVVPAVTGGFLASLAGTSFVWTLLDMSVQTFAIARALVSLVLLVLMAFAMMVATNGDRFPRLPTFMVTATALGGYIAPLRQDPSLFIYWYFDTVVAIVAFHLFILARYVIFPGIRYVKVSFWLGFYFAFFGPDDYLLSSSRSATYYGATVALLRLATELSLQILAVPDPSCLNQRSRPFRLCNPLHLPVCVTTL
ncbi:hypothetical protein B5M09_008341 [Aphanomyces astaci]|uniref:Uncharacterized protein n=1 Tax=Aphanomyces astaci TaxID=112090 RepID=A0A425D1U3_APHAT|nr:hypothetical protein B5M09_008341 [Aphanomyces astaci]